MQPVPEEARCFRGLFGRILIAGTFMLSAAFACAGQTNVLTYHNDNSRTAQNLNETILTPVNVNSQTFGVLGTIPVDGLVDAEPLYVANLTVAGGAHNVLFVVTENDSVYAFDADSFAQLWHVSVVGSGETPSDDHGCGQVTPTNGITSTPVIDRAAGTHGTIFVVGMTKDASGNYHHRLHALDLTTGAEMSGSPTEITGSYTSPQTSVQTTFAPSQYLERTGLLLMNGVIYLSWTSHCDFTPYQGWVMGYSESTLQQVSVTNLTPNGSAGAVWMSGEGLAGDSSGNIYFLDGQGTFDDTLNASGFPINGDFGNGFIKLSTAGNSLSVADYFNMHNTDTETLNDEDLGAGGLVLLPDLKDSTGNTWQLAVGAGKDANIYVVNRNSMGKFNTTSDSAIYQEITGGLANGQFAAPAYFNNTFYIGGFSDKLKAFSISNALLSTAPTSTSTNAFAYPGTSPSISANGTANGIVWAIEKNGTGGILHAFNAANLGVEYYNSNQAANGRDNFADNKFVTPMITNGKVYVGTPTNVTVFGLLGTTAVTVPTISPAGGSITNTQPITLSDATSGSTIYFTTNGATPSITPSEQYTGPFTLSQSGTVQAIAVAGASVSSVASATFTVLPPAATPTISPNGGSIAPSQNITLSDTTSGASIFYTTDGSTPVPGSGTTKTYSTPFTLATSGTVNAIATATGFSPSAMASASFTLQTAAGTAAISIDFVGMGPSPMAASEVAGVVPMPNWNDAAGPTGSGMALLDQNGNATGATMSWTSDDVWSQTITEAPGNARMMKGYLDNGQQHTSVVTFSGLPATASGYSVYVYAQGAASNGSSNTGTYQVSGTGITTSSVALTYTSQFNGTFTQATASNPVGNYVVLTIPPVTSFTIQAIPTAASPSFLRAPINGVQVVPLQVSDFTLSASPASSTANPGGSSTYTVSAAGVNGFSGTVALTSSGLPTGATASFSPASIAAGGSSTLTITTTGSTPAANSTITITGTSGTLTHTKTVTLSVTDFSVSVTPSSMTVNPGGSATYTVSAASLNAFSGTVSLTATSLPTGATASFNPASIAAGASSTLTVTTTSSTPAANSTLTVTGTSGTLAHTATATLNVADFTISATPATQSVNIGGSATYTVSAAAVNGFSGTVALSASGLPTGATASFSPASIAAGASSTLTITTTGSTPAASSTITLTGSSGTLSHTAAATLNVTDFSLSATPASQSVSVGGSVTYTVNTAAVNGFSGAIALSASGLPTGATASFSPASIAAGGSSTLTIVTTSTTPAATSTITITGASGSDTHAKTVALSVTDFTVSASPSSASVAAGSSTTYAVSASAVNGFTSTVVLSVSGLPAGATPSFSPASITPGTNSTLTITTTSSATAGTSNLTISGGSGALSHSAAVTLTITASAPPPPPPPAAGAISIDFVGLGANPMANSEVAGAVPLSNWNDASGASSTAAMPLLDQNGNATGATVTWTSDDVWNQNITETAGNARMMKGYLDNGQQHTSIVNVTGLASNAGGYNVYVYAQGSVSTGGSDTGIYQISGTGIATSSVSLTYTSLFNGTFTQATTSSPVGNYVVLTIPNVSAFTLQAIPSAASSGFLRAPINGVQIVPIPAPDFALSATPSSASTNPGGNATYAISAAAVNGFSGSVALSASGLPAGATFSFNPASITPGVNSTLTISTASGTPAANSTLTITGTSGSLTHTQTVTLSVSDFTLSASPASSSVTAGSNATYTVSSTALNGFTGSITLSASGLPTGAGASFSPASISVGGSSTLTITTSSTTPAGSSTVTISGSTAALAHSTTAGLTVTAQGPPPPPPPAAGAISIDFVGLGTNPMASSEVAGVVAVSNWNDANGATGTAMPLVDQNGNSTSATVSWTADDVWDQPITDAPGNARLMKGYLDNGQQNTTVITVTGLPSNAGGYTIYVYAQGASTTNVNTGIYQISGTGITTQSATLTYNANFSGVFTQALPGNLVGNYVMLTIPNVPAFTLQGIPSTANNPFLRAPINGIQIVPVPAPDFSLSASPSTSSVTAGTSATHTVSASAINGFSGGVTLSTSGLPAGAGASFSPASITPGSSSTLTVTTNSSTTPAGTFTITIGGASGSLSHSTAVSLTVSSGAPPPPPPASGVISVDFVGLSTNPMAGSEVAGVVAVGNWNDATGASSSTPLPLMDQNGNPTTATIAWTADDVWNEGITDQSGNFRMMRGYLDNGQRNTTVITVASLPSNANGYDVYVYAQGSVNGSTKTATYQISGTGITTSSVSLTYNSMFSGTFTQATSANPAGNYVILTIPNATGFTLQGIPGTSTNSAIRAPINGIQIVPR